MELRMCLLILLALLLATNPTEAKHRQLESLEEVLERLIVEYEAEAEELKEDEEEEEETGGEEEEEEEDEAEDELKKKEEEKKRKKKEEEEQKKKEEEEEKIRKDEEEASKPRSLHRDRDSQIPKTTEIPLQEAATIEYSTTPRSLGHNIYTKPGSSNKKCYCEEITDTTWPFTVASGGRSRQEKGGGDSGAREAKGNDGSSEKIDGKSSDGVGVKESDNPKEDNNSGDSERVKRSPIDAGLRQPCLGCGPKPDSLQNERHLFHHQCLH